MFSCHSRLNLLPCDNCPECFFFYMERLLVNRGLFCCSESFDVERSSNGFFRLFAFESLFWHHLIAYLIQPLINERVFLLFLIEQAETVPLPYGRLLTKRGLVLIFLPFIAIIYCSLFWEVTFLSLLYHALTHRQLVCQLQNLIKEGFLLKQTGSFQVSFVFTGKKMNHNLK